MDININTYLPRKTGKNHNKIMTAQANRKLYTYHKKPHKMGPTTTSPSSPLGQRIDDLDFDAASHTCT